MRSAGNSPLVPLAKHCMRDIDPHWQSTEPTVIGGTPAKTQPRRRAASRRPAALLGIALVAALGIAMYVRMTPIQAELVSLEGSDTSSAPSDAVTVTITATGLQPHSVTLRPGQSIIWKNETNLPHIFESDEIKDDSDQTMYSPAIFPNSQQSFTLSKKQAPGTYTYASVTASDVSGEIEVSAVAVQTGTSSAASSLKLVGMQDDEFFPATTSSAGMNSAASVGTSSAPKTPPKSNDPLLAGFTLSAQQPEDVYAPPAEDNVLVPTNPYSIGSPKSGPPLATATTPTKQPTKNTNLHTGAPLVKPKTQPQSGSNTWIVALIITTVLLTGYLLMPRKKA